MRCKEHPDAPHSFMRDASHSAGRYVCECESWEPPKREWIGLTDEEIWSNGSRLSLSERGIREFARAIEAKLKEKNGL
jgi:hypothetical protein